jgi:hypothetical protein
LLGDYDQTDPPADNERAYIRYETTHAAADAPTQFHDHDGTDGRLTKRLDESLVRSTVAATAIVAHRPTMCARVGDRSG